MGVQRQLKADGQGLSCLLKILNLGKYERQHYIGLNPNLREAEQEQQLEEKEKAFRQSHPAGLLRRENRRFLTAFQGVKAGRLVAVGPVNLPVNAPFLLKRLSWNAASIGSRVWMSLGFEFEMGLFPNLLDEAKSKGIDLAPKVYPCRGVLTSGAVDRKSGGVSRCGVY